MVPQISLYTSLGAVKAIRQLTLLPLEEFVPQMRQLGWDARVIFFLVPVIPRAHTSGVARWLNPHKALYGKTNDRFWFTFFHEAAHILLHGKKFLENGYSSRIPRTILSSQTNNLSTDSSVTDS